MNPNGVGQSFTPITCDCRFKLPPEKLVPVALDPVGVGHADLMLG